MRKNIILICLLFLSISFLFCQQVEATQALNRIVAVVNGEMISYHDLQLASTDEVMQARLNPKNKEDAKKIDTILRGTLDNMIADIIVRQEAERLKITAAEADIDAELNAVVERSKLTEEEFFKQAGTQGLTKKIMQDKIRQRIMSQRLMSTMVGRKVFDPSKAEVAAYFNQHGGITTGKAVQFALIVYAPNQPVKQWEDSIRAGRISFEEAANRVTIGPGRGKGGKLEEMPWEGLDKAWQDRLSKMKQGQVSGLFKLNDMYAQVKLINFNPGTTPSTLDEAYAQIEELLKNRKINERYKEYIEELKKKARIEIRY